MKDIIFCNTNLTESGCNITLEAKNVLVSVFNPGEEKEVILKFKSRYSGSTVIDQNNSIV